MIPVATPLPATATVGQGLIAKAAARHWDVIVIGTGVGGGLAGRRLAELGLSVLFVEKGPVGYRTEGQDLRTDLADYTARQARGFWPTPIETRIDAERPHRFFAPLGSGVGGSSVFYAAAAERPERHDIDATEAMPHPTGGWPVGFDTFRPYFTQAEAALSIRGEKDPLSELPGPLLPAPPLTEAEARMFDDLRAAGLHPYRAHEALRRLPGCSDCLGRKCPRPCKMDGRSAGVEPALDTGNATLLPNCAVEDLIEAQGRITAARVRANGRDYLLQADVFVLAAGALNSPNLLLRSTGTHASGCANSSGWVGRGLMFHVSEMVAFWPRRGSPAVGATRALSFRDLYTHDRQRLGLVQSMGLAADAGQIAGHLKGVLSRSRLRGLPGASRLATIAARIGADVFGSATVLVGLLEDLPYADNRVEPHPEDPEVPLIHYRISDELKARRALLRQLLRQKLRRHRLMFLNFGPTLNFGHPSGTLRFGSDPSTSVLDAECKAHDLDNLYVADASFMPTSMGVNPSLTIAANALRVGDAVAARHFAARRKAS
ncbi:MAG: glucose-methanol-choline oxidoreductase [Rhodobacter sp.]|nr:glucose-methanol-choline oxidoreductase [Rhodobacter sp.]